MKYLIGIDLGTTAAKCAIYGEDGACVADATEEMKIRYPRSGEAEQDAMDFYTVACRLIRACLETSRIDRKSIAGIGIDSQMGGIMSVDRAFRPVTYYDTPLDSRSAEENRSMHEKCGDLILRKNGSLSTFGNKILYWKKRSEWKDIRAFVQPSAFVAGQSRRAHRRARPTWTRHSSAFRGSRTWRNRAGRRSCAGSSTSTWESCRGS